MSLMKPLPIERILQKPDDTFVRAEAQADLGPWERLWRLLAEDWRDLAALLAYTVMVGVLSLAVPLAASALVNTIATGVWLQPLVVLTLIVFGCLAVAGVLQLVQLALAERMQQRIFARTALRLAARLPFVQTSALQGEYAPELVNRFFDVITAQKALAKLLLTTPAAMLQVVVGLALLAIYSPYLVAFNVTVLLFAGAVWVVLGRGGLTTSLKESSKKYRVAEWLEELARGHLGFKMGARPDFPLDRTDGLVVDYIQARRAHFQVLLRQAAGSAFFRAAANAGILAIGGWLVISGGLTLGQLVAAELVVISVLSALDKLTRSLEDLYDLLTSLEKISHATELPIERQGGRQVVAEAGALVECRNVHFAYRPGVDVLNRLDLRLSPGDRVSLVGASGAGKSTLSALLCGLLEPSVGLVSLNNVEVRDADLEALRCCIGLVSDNADALFEGTIEQNILMGRDIPHADMIWALEVSQLTEELARLPEGMKTMLVSEGRNLSRGQAQRLLLARALVGRPQLLILDEAFTGIDECHKLAILDNIYAPEHCWTILNISHDPEVVLRSELIHVLEGGRIAETGTPAELAIRPASRFSTLFPALKSSLVA